MRIVSMTRRMTTLAAAATLALVAFYAHADADQARAEAAFRLSQTVPPGALTEPQRRLVFAYKWATLEHALKVVRGVAAGAPLESIPASVAHSPLVAAVVDLTCLARRPPGT